MSNWICFEEQPPPESGQYLIWPRVHDLPTAYYNANTKEFLDGDGWRVFVPLHGITHWQPLPEGPV